MHSPRAEGVGPFSAELSDAALGDERLNRRLGLLADRLAARPAESFPKALDDAELEAAYRFFGDERVSPEGILAPHVRQSAQRAAGHAHVLVVHDTTQFEFPGQAKRSGLGRLIRPGQGFFGHFSLVLAADGTREPLGVLAMETVFRHDRPVPRQQRTARDNRGESARWRRGIDAAESVLGGHTTAIHVMDREADSYAIYAALTEHQPLFVIRSFQDRVLAGEGAGRLRATAQAARVTLRRDVPLSPRPHINGPKGTRHPARRSRIARLSVAATAVELPRTGDARAAAATSVRLHVIHVFERHPPPGEPAVDWFLLTNLPVDTRDAVAFAVDCYRGRWTIEDFFKALKTGCQHERRQLDSAASLLNALAIFAPIAWRLLRLRHLARSDQRTPATAALTPTQIEVLRAMTKRPLPARPPCATRCVPSRHSAATSRPTAILAGSYWGAGCTTCCSSNSAGAREGKPRSHQS